MHQAYLLLGSNQGDRRHFLTEAIHALCALGTVTAQSAFYETEAWGRTDQPAFLNQAICLETSLAPLPLLASILSIERTLGRERKERYGPRTIDIDILLYDSLVLQLPQLTIPHPELPNRRFALTALADIAPDVQHPTKLISVKQLLEQCSDPLAVRPIG